MQGAKNHQGYRVQNLFTKAEYMAAMYLANQSKWCLAIGEGPYMGICCAGYILTLSEMESRKILKNGR
jgi:hypothetical protein